MLDHASAELLANLAQDLLGITLTGDADRSATARVAGEKGLDPIPYQSDPLVASKRLEDDLASGDFQIDPLDAVRGLGWVRVGDSLIDHGKAERGGGGGDSGPQGGPGGDDDGGEDSDGTHGVFTLEWTGVGPEPHGEFLGSSEKKETHTEVRGYGGGRGFLESFCWGWRVGRLPLWVCNDAAGLDGDLSRSGVS